MIIGNNASSKIYVSNDRQFTVADKKNLEENTKARHTHKNKNVLDGITPDKVKQWDSAEENVQPDWNQTDTAADDYIKNKPDFDTKEDASNKISELSSASTNEQYPGAKAVVDYVGSKLSSVYKLKGSIASALLPHISNKETGDVYNIVDNNTITLSTDSLELSCYVNTYPENKLVLVSGDFSMLQSFVTGDKLYINGYEFVLTAFKIEGYWLAEWKNKYSNFTSGNYLISKIEYTLDLNSGDNVAWTGHRWDKFASSTSTYITPQKYGAVGDGIHDDTDAIQAALDAGGCIYFPAGRYKVTKQLTANASCKIMMFKPYPTAMSKTLEDKTVIIQDYPRTPEENFMGARIETYSTDYGMVVGDGVEIDGLFLRAMIGFSGILFKYDGSLGQRTYPSQLRISHVLLDTEKYNVNPECMFDFVPKGSFFAILEDIFIGSSKSRQIYDYGFRADLNKLGNSNWSSSIRIKNLCIDALCDYSLYIDGARSCGNWVIENPSIQTYPYVKNSAEYCNRTGHKDVVTFKNMSGLLILGGHIWDTEQAIEADSIERLFNVENCFDISCFGCHKQFDEIETVLTGKLKKPDNLNIANLQMSIEGVEDTGANRLILSDGNNNNKSIDIPSVSISNEQLNTGISKWFDENAQPKEVPGRNKFNVDDPDNVEGYLLSDGTVSTHSNYAGHTVSHFIPVKYGMEIRIGKFTSKSELDLEVDLTSGNYVAAYRACYYDKDKNMIENSHEDWTDTAGAHSCSYGDAEFVRICWIPTLFNFTDVFKNENDVSENKKVYLMVTTDGSQAHKDYEDYYITLEGGIGSFVLLQSPNGTQYHMAVDNDGTLKAIPVNQQE